LIKLPNYTSPISYDLHVRKFTLIILSDGINKKKSMYRLSNFNHEQSKNNSYVLQAKLLQLISRVIRVIKSQVANAHNLINM